MFKTKSSITLFFYYFFHILPASETELVRTIHIIIKKCDIIFMSSTIHI